MTFLVVIPACMVSAGIGWRAHQMYIKQMWRIERSARLRAQGRRP